MTGPRPSDLQAELHLDRIPAGYPVPNNSNYWCTGYPVSVYWPTCCGGELGFRLRLELVRSKSPFLPFGPTEEYLKELINEMIANNKWERPTKLVWVRVPLCPSGPSCQWIYRYKPQVKIRQWSPTGVLPPFLDSTDFWLAVAWRCKSKNFDFPLPSSVSRHRTSLGFHAQADCPPCRIDFRAPNTVRFSSAC